MVYKHKEPTKHGFWNPPLSRPSSQNAGVTTAPSRLTLRVNRLGRGALWESTANSLDDRAIFGRARYFGCLKGGSKSVQVLFDGIEAVMVLTLMILK